WQLPVPFAARARRTGSGQVENPSKCPIDFPAIVSGASPGRHQAMRSHRVGGGSGWWQRFATAPVQSATDTVPDILTSHSTDLSAAAQPAQRPYTIRRPTR